MTTSDSGVCRICGCAGESCTLANGEKCWLTAEGICSAAACLREASRQRALARAARPRKRTTADIHALIVAERAAKRKRYRDAAAAKGLLRSHEEGEPA